MNTENDNLRALIKDIQGALNTEEEGEALVEVARNAHRAELALRCPGGEMVSDYFQTGAEAQAWINNRLKKKEGK